MRLRGKRIIGITVTALLLLTGCALIRSGGDTLKPRSCGDSPKSAIAKFMQGITELSLTPIRAAIAEGVSIWSVFGGGDDAKGREIIKQLVRHPEVLEPDSDYGRIFDLVEVEDLGNGESRVLLEREDIVTTRPGGRLDREPREVEKVFRRSFLVRFQPGTNCITAVRSPDPAWTRVR